MLFQGIVLSNSSLYYFLAPTGAQEMLISVRSSVRPVQVCLEQFLLPIRAIKVFDKLILCR